MEAENSNEMHQSPVASECGKLNDHGLCNKHICQGHPKSTQTILSKREKAMKGTKDAHCLTLDLNYNDLIKCCMSRVTFKDAFKK